MTILTTKCLTDCFLYTILTFLNGDGNVTLKVAGAGLFMFTHEQSPCRDAPEMGIFATSLSC
jgi:hypothetical protein